MYIDSYNYTNQGKYPVNEDSFYCGDDLFVVADGLGGHGGGNIASACAVQYISENYRSAQEITELISGANNAVRDLDNGSRSTVAAVFIENGKLYYTNVGDSRVYLFRNGKMLCRTKDHSVCQAAVDAGTMTEDEIRGHEDRSRLLKVLGENEKLKFTVYEPLDLRDGDAFLICSDGFWDFVYETEMEADLLKADSAKHWGDYMLRRHLKRSRCDDDNFTLVCGIIHKEPDVIPNTSSPVEIMVNGLDETGAAGVAVAGSASASKSARRAAIGISIGVLILAALCVGGILLFKNMSGKGADQSDSDSDTAVSTDVINSDDISESTISSSEGSSDVVSSSESTDSSEASGIGAGEVSSEPTESSSGGERPGIPGIPSSSSTESSEESSSSSSESDRFPPWWPGGTPEISSGSGDSGESAAESGDASEPELPDDSDPSGESSDDGDSWGLPLPPALVER